MPPDLLDHRGVRALLHGAAAGAWRGGVAAIAYAAVLTLWTIGHDVVTTSITHTTAGGDTGVGWVLTVALLGLAVALIASTVGVLGGAVAGAAMVPLARRWRGSTATLRVVSACLAFAVGVVAFPTVPLGSGVTGFDEIVSLKLVPALIGAGAANWQAAALRRGVSPGRASTPG